MAKRPTRTLSFSEELAEKCAQRQSRGNISSTTVGNVTDSKTQDGCSDLSSNLWYHNINGKDARQLLLNQGQDGSFLVRPSATKKGTHTLSVRCEDDVCHLQILHEQAMYSLPNDIEFPSIPELISHYKENPYTIKSTGKVLKLKFTQYRATDTTNRPTHAAATMPPPQVPALPSKLGEETTSNRRTSEQFRRQTPLPCIPDNRPLPTGPTGYEASADKEGKPARPPRPKKAAGQSASSHPKPSIAQKPEPILPPRSYTPSLPKYTSPIPNDSETPQTTRELQRQFWGLTIAGDVDVAYYPTHLAGVHVREFRWLKDDTLDDDDDYETPADLFEPCAPGTASEQSDTSEEIKLEAPPDEVKSKLSRLTGKSNLNSRSLLDDHQLLKVTKENALVTWTELVEEKKPDINESIGETERNLQESIWEIYVSEKAFCKSLNKVSNFSDNDKLGEFMTVVESKTLFSNIHDVKSVSDNLLASLTRAMDFHRSCFFSAGAVCRELLSCTALSNYAESHIKYYQNHKMQMDKLTKLRENPKFEAALKETEMRSAIGNQKLAVLLQLPLMHLARKPLLVEAVLRRLGQDCEGYKVAVDCRDELKKIVKECQDAMRKFESLPKLLEDIQNIQVDHRHSVSINESQNLLKAGYLKQAVDTTLSALRGAFGGKKKVHYIVLSDLVIITEQTGDKKRTLLTKATRSLVRADEVELTNEQHFILRVSILEQTGTKVSQEQYLACPNEVERLRWASALEDVADQHYVTVTREPNEREKYQDKNQMVVVHDYDANEPDELTLRVAEVLIIEERKEGWDWFKGIRVRDGAVGWFPSLCAECIPQKERNIKLLLGLH